MPIIPQIHVGDTLELKKNHPCGSNLFTVMRIGSEIRIVCRGCGHDIVFPRPKLERMIKKISPREEEKMP